MVMILPTGGIFNCDTAEKIQTKGFLLNQLLILLLALLFILVTLPSPLIWPRFAAFCCEPQKNLVLLVI